VAVNIDAKGVYYRQLNSSVKENFALGVEEVILDHVNGQRYIGAGITGSQKIIVNGILGNDAAAYMEGLTLIVNGNAQDAMGNSMNKGTIVIHGNAGDTVGYAMRGGEIFIKGDVGYRVGIHMKEYREKVPVIVIGGKAGDFLGEYMAGGILILLGLTQDDRELVGNYCGTGMHGGVMYIRGEVLDYKLGQEVKALPLDDKDIALLSSKVEVYVTHFGGNAKEILAGNFIKLLPVNKSPYGSMYAKY